MKRQGGFAPRCGCCECGEGGTQNWELIRTRWLWKLSALHARIIKSSSTCDFQEEFLDHLCFNYAEKHPRMCQLSFRFIVFAATRSENAYSAVARAAVERIDSMLKFWPPPSRMCSRDAFCALNVILCCSSNLEDRWRWRAALYAKGLKSIIAELRSGVEKETLVLR